MPFSTIHVCDCPAAGSGLRLTPLVASGDYIIGITTKHIVREFFGNDLTSKQIADDDNLLRSRVLDSIGMVKLILYLEEKFKLNIGEEDLIPENFETIAAIVTFLQKKKATGKSNSENSC